jgi:hypothetical protein
MNRTWPNPARLRRARGLAARQVRGRTRPGRCAASRTLDHSSASRWRCRRANHGTRFSPAWRCLRLLVDPMAIQGEASRLLGERLLTDRAYYAESTKRRATSWSNELRSRRGLEHGRTIFAVRLQLGGPTFRWAAGGRRRHQTSPLNSDGDRPAWPRSSRGFRGKRRLVRDGRLIAAPCA